jgi:pimeloyl-ACP methyl ester carboxylesterase
LEALAAAGYRAIAPDMRGYGQTDKPDAIDQYTLLHLTGDMVGLLDAIGTDQAVVVGHDWGAPVAWRCALFRPDRFRAVVGLSVPFPVRGPDRPSTVMPRAEKQRFYQLYFQTPGVAEAELEKDVHNAIKTTLFALSGDAPVEDPASLTMLPSEGGWLDGKPTTQSLPPWLTDSDIEFYVEEFKRTGFGGGLNWYRNIDRNWELLAPWSGAKVQVPALYVVGDRDGFTDRRVGAISSLA